MGSLEIILKIMGSKKSVFCTILMFSLASSSTTPSAHSEVDMLIEYEITQKLTDDLIQSLERKFQGDLDKSVDTVLTKVRIMLQNGSLYINEKLEQMQNFVTDLKSRAKNEVVNCLQNYQNETIALSEKALHQMVVCGYALIGHDPSKAVAQVIQMKQKIREGLKPISAHRDDLYDLLKLCGHEQESLKAVMKCVISKSPLIKSSMMDVTQKLSSGIVDLTKMLAHGAMHEACLIEVIKVVEEEGQDLLGRVKTCALGDVEGKAEANEGNADEVTSNNVNNDVGGNDD